ncbi:MAG: hypothetical protein ACLFSB_09035 [Chitinispirillaceae bacterium]
MTKAMINSTGKRVLQTFLILMCLAGNQTVIWAQAESRSGDFAGSLLGRLSGELEPSEHPYKVVSTIVIPREDTLTIPAGTVFLFDEFTGMKIRGTIKVMGKEKKPVVFSSMRDTAYVNSDLIPAPYDWDGILVEAESHRAIFNFAHIMYSLHGIKVLAPSVQIKQCRFSSNAQSDFVFDEKEYSSEGEPFSFVREPEKKLVLKTDSDSLDDTDSEAEIPSPILEKAGRGEKIAFRILSSAFLVGGSIYGGVKTAPFLDAQGDYNHISEVTSENKQAFDSKKKFDRAYEKRNENLLHMAAGYGLAALGLVGLSISFAF